MRIPLPRSLRKSGLPAVPSFPCPLCGELVKQGALGCRACGSDGETGWSGQANEVVPDLGSRLDDFDYGSYLEREFSSSTGSKHMLRRFMLVVLILALIMSLGFWRL